MSEFIFDFGVEQKNKVKLYNTFKKTPRSLEQKNKVKQKRKYVRVRKYNIFTQTPRSPIVIERYKLMWFLNPKAASTVTRELLTRMSNENIGTRTENLKYDDLDNLVRLNKYGARKAYTFLTSSEWTRVIILREPKERLLSAYLNKEKQDIDPATKRSYFNLKCCDTKSTEMIENCHKHKFTFSEFVNITGECAPTNYHWNPQYNEIDDWNIINFVINFKQLANDTERMLRSLGNDVWDKYGATGWGVDGNSAVFKKNTRHSTNARSVLDEYYTPELERIVERRFSKDYDLLRKYFPDDYV